MRIAYYNELILRARGLQSGYTDGSVTIYCTCLTHQHFAYFLLMLQYEEGRFRSLHLLIV